MSLPTTTFIPWHPKLRSTFGSPTTYRFDSGANWLFLVEDELSDAAGLTFSTETSGVIKIGRCKPTLTGVDVVTPADPFFDSTTLLGRALSGPSYTASDGTTEYYSKIADHWHIFAHGFHWIAASLVSELNNTGYGVLLFKFAIDADGNAKEGWASQVIKNPAFDAYRFLQNPTNDLCMVIAPHRGVYVIISQNPDSQDPPDPGVASDAQGTRWLHVDRDGNLLGERKVFGVTGMAHFGGASASRHDDFGGMNRSWRLLAPEYTVVNTDSDLKLITLDRDIDPATATIETVVTQVGYAHSRVTEAWVNHSRAMVYKKVVSGGADEGAIVLDLYTGAGTTRDSTENLLDESGVEVARGQRPHVLYWNDLLIIAFDDETYNQNFLNVRQVT